MKESAILPEEELLALLKNKKLTLCTAESCTGGMIGKRITSLSGVSEVYAGGVISYSNDVKMNLLSVKKETLEAYGAVSEQTAAEMAQGVKNAIGTDCSVSVTGIAGPTGGTKEKPVGTVCFGVCVGEETDTVTVHFGEDKSREKIRSFASVFAIELLISKITEVENA